VQVAQPEQEVVWVALPVIVRRNLVETAAGAVATAGPLVVSGLHEQGAC
jgi:hypothetical protein